jgi:hypothetical protein
MIAVASKVKLGFRFIADSLKEAGGQWRRMNTVSRYDEQYQGVSNSAATVPHHVKICFFRRTEVC